MTRVTVRLTPRAGRDAVDGWEDDARSGRVLRLRVSAPAAEGRANDAALRLLARALDVPVSRLTLARGTRSRTKLIDVDGLTTGEIDARLR